MRPKKSLSKLLADYQPHPGKSFYQRMEHAPWSNKETPMSHQSMRPARSSWQFIVAIIVVLAVFSLSLSISIPSVRAALSNWLGLSVAPSNQMPAAAVTLVAVTPSLTAAAPTQTAAAPSTAAPPTQIQPAAAPSQPPEISQLSPQAGWNVLALSAVPDGYKFQSAYLDTNHQMVILTYLATRPLPGAADPKLTASKSITLLQALKNDFVPMQIAPATQVEDVQVNGQPAVYAVGAWDTEFVPDANDPNGGKMVSTWRNELPVQNLYWQAGKVYLVLVTDDETLSKQDLINTAAGAGGG